MSTLSWFRLARCPEELPTVYVKATFTSKGYRICMTDLSNLWIEELGESEICARAVEEKLSINPSDDSSQMVILLDKIAIGLPQAKLIGHAREDPDDGYYCRDQLDLTIEAALPKPLKPLKWTVFLKMQDSNRKHGLPTFTKEVTSPLLANLHSVSSEIQRYQILLREKDHVISRLLDRLESAGTDLTTVFPNTSGLKLMRKLSQRSQLERHVKGLKPYDPNVPTTSDPEVFSAETIFDVLTPPATLRDECASNLAAILADLEAEGKFWPERIRDDFTPYLMPDWQTPREVGSSYSREFDNDTTDEEFESNDRAEDVVKSPRSRNQSSSDRSSPTTPPAMRRVSPTSLSKNQLTTPGRLGVIGGRKPTLPEKEVGGNAMTLPTSKDVQASRSKRIGIIGGGGKTSDERSMSSSPGSKMAVDRSPTTGNTSPPKSAVEPERQVRESSQDRADARREDLKRQLAATGSSSLNKKKRKF